MTYLTSQAKFYFFEKIVFLFYDRIFTNPKFVPSSSTFVCPRGLIVRSSYGKGTQLGITFASGYLAGVVCAIVSHPADTMVSQLGKADNKGLFTLGLKLILKERASLRLPASLAT